jgi:hypothetical protein
MEKQKMSQAEMLQEAVRRYKLSSSKFREEFCQWGPTAGPLTAHWFESENPDPTDMLYVIAHILDVAAEQ